MMFLIFRAETVQNGDGLINGRGIDPDRLEAAFESGILFDVLAVLIHGGGPDALEFPTGESGFNDVGGIHRPLG